MIASLPRRAFIAAFGLALTAGAATAQPVAKDEIVVASPVLRQYFDPSLMVATTDYLAYDVVFDGLLDLTAEGKKPALATSWVVSPDGKQVDFTLRSGVVFHNGDPFTAEDVKYTFEKILKPETNHSYRAGFVDSLDHVEIIDPKHVRFVLKHPWLAFFTTAPRIITRRSGPRASTNIPSAPAHSSWST